MKKFRSFAVLSLLVFFLGCGESSTVVESSQPVPEDQLRVVLDGLIESGEPLGSGGMVLQDSIQEIRGKDPTKADALSSLFNDLIAEQNPAQVKSKAKAMRDKL